EVPVRAAGCVPTTEQDEDAAPRIPRHHRGPPGKRAMYGIGMFPVPTRPAPRVALEANSPDASVSPEHHHRVAARIVGHGMPKTARRMHDPVQLLPADPVPQPRVVVGAQVL